MAYRLVEPPPSAPPPPSLPPPPSSEVREATLGHVFVNTVFCCLLARASLHKKMSGTRECGLLCAVQRYTVTRCVLWSSLLVHCSWVNWYAAGSRIRVNCWYVNVDQTAATSPIQPCMLPQRAQNKLVRFSQNYCLLLQDVFRCVRTLPDSNGGVELRNSSDSTPTLSASTWTRPSTNSSVNRWSARTTCWTWRWKSTRDDAPISCCSSYTAPGTRRHSSDFGWPSPWNQRTTSWLTSWTGLEWMTWRRRRELIENSFRYRKPAPEVESRRAARRAVLGWVYEGKGSRGTRQWGEVYISDQASCWISTSLTDNPVRRRPVTSAATGSPLRPFPNRVAASRYSSRLHSRSEEVMTTATIQLQGWGVLAGVQCRVVIPALGAAPAGQGWQLTGTGHGRRIILLEETGWWWYSSSCSGGERAAAAAKRASRASLAAERATPISSRWRHWTMRRKRMEAGNQDAKQQWGRDELGVSMLSWAGFHHQISANCRWWDQALTYCIVLRTSNYHHRHHSV